MNRQRWVIVGLLFTASLINYFDRATISFALPLISKELHLGPGSQGRPALRVLLVVRADADPDGRARRSGEPALALRRRVHAVVDLAGPDGPRDRPRLADRVPHAARASAKRSICPGGSKIVSLLFPPAERGLPSGLFDAGTRTGLVIEGVLVPWMLMHYGWRVELLGGRLRRAALADPLVPAHAEASSALRQHGGAGVGSPRVRRRGGHAGDQPQPARHLPRVLLLRLLLVFPRELAARLPRHVARPDDDDGPASTRRCRTSCSA